MRSRPCLSQQRRLRFQLSGTSSWPKSSLDRRETRKCRVHSKSNSEGRRCVHSLSRLQGCRNWPPASSCFGRPEADGSRAPMGKKRTLRVSVKVVPPGTLQPNPKNPFARESPQVRRSGMIRTLIQGLARTRREITPPATRQPMRASPTVAVRQTARIGPRRSSRRVGTNEPGRTRGKTPPRR